MPLKKLTPIAICATTGDALCAVNFSCEHHLLTTINAGGHNAAGRRSCDGGLMIDVSNMNVGTVDDGARRARVEGGAIWEDFDRETQKHGLSAPGGLVSATGVAGLSRFETRAALSAFTCHRLLLACSQATST